MFFPDNSKIFEDTLSKFNIVNLSSDFAGYRLGQNWLDSCRMSPLIDLLLYAELCKQCSTLSPDKEKFFLLDNKKSITFFIINSKYIFQFSYSGRSLYEPCILAVFDNKFQNLFYFKDDGFKQILKLEEKEVKFQSHVLKNKKHSVYMGSNNFLLNVNADSIKLKCHNPDLTSVKLVDNKIHATFTNTAYSRMILDSNYNILEMQLNKKLKSQFKSEKNLYNIVSYEDITKNINSTFTHSIDYYQLVNDEQIILKGNKKRFETDINYIKFLTENNQLLYKKSKKIKKNILKIHKQCNLFKNIYSINVLDNEHYKNMVLPKEKINTYQYHYNIYNTNDYEKYNMNKYKTFLFIHYYFNKNKNLINNEICGLMSDIKNDIKEMFEFRKNKVF